MKRTLLCLLLPVLLALAACHDERTADFRFVATIEQPSGSDPLAKTFLLREQWVYWQLGDSISIGADNTSEAVDGILVNIGAAPQYSPDDFNGVFLSWLDWGARYFAALFPYREHNVISGVAAGSKDFVMKLDMPAVQPVDNDTSFSRNVYPMAAWYGGHWDDAEGSTAYNLDFHALAGIVRLQFTNASDAKTISSVTVTSASDQLSGLFNVLGYKTSEPYLAPTESSPSEAARTITLDCGTEGRTFDGQALCSFYLALPALGDNESTKVYQNLTITLNATDGSSVSRRIASVPLRRSGITYMPALEVADWSASGTNATTVRLSGNGTPERPFRVYSYSELRYLRDCYNSAARTINNQPIKPDTRIWLMRSDIALDNDWTVGITDFVGHLEDKSNASNPGITNSGHAAPLFESIGADGVVEGITLKVGNVSTASTDDFSPFCKTNAGTLRNCVLAPLPAAPASEVSVGGNLGGLCLANSGTIDGCRNEANLRATGHAVGVICHTNTGTVRGCQISTPFSIGAAASVGGIVYDNQGGTVRDCYYAVANTGGSANWGGIAFANSGTVEHCYVDNYISTSGRVGGIVFSNTGGKVDYCWNQAMVQGASVGGIVHTMTGGTVINCFLDPALAQITLLQSSAADLVGAGLVASLADGTVVNSYAHFPHVIKQGTGAVIGAALGKCTGGSVKYCYAYETSSSSRTFYGTATTDVAFSKCYLVGGSQENIATTLEGDNFNVTGTGGYEDGRALLEVLNTEQPSGAKPWTVVTTGAAPSLEPYTVSN